MIKMTICVVSIVSAVDATGVQTIGIISINSYNVIGSWVMGHVRVTWVMDQFTGGSDWSYGSQNEMWLSLYDTGAVILL